MTLARTALRVAAINALMNRTIAEGRVYDSLIGSLDLANAEERRPVIIVITEKDEGPALSDQDGGPPFLRLIDLNIEIGVVAQEADGSRDLYYPETDADAEAALDLLEYNTINALMFDLGPAAQLFRKVAKTITKYDSLRSSDDETGVKIAARQYILTCKVQDSIPDLNSTETGYNLFPEPLRTVANSLPTDSPCHGILTKMANALYPVTAPSFNGMDIDMARNPTSPDVAPIKFTADPEQ